MRLDIRHADHHGSTISRIPLPNNKETWTMKKEVFTLNVCLNIGFILLIVLCGLKPYRRSKIHSWISIHTIKYILYSSVYIYQLWVYYKLIIQILRKVPITIINIYDYIAQAFEYVKGENMLIFSSFLLDRQLDKSSKIWFAFYDNCACEVYLHHERKSCTTFPQKSFSTFCKQGKPKVHFKWGTLLKLHVLYRG